LDDKADGTIVVVYSDVEEQRQAPELKMVMASMITMGRPCQTG
jgi:hypothetical protein